MLTIAYHTLGCKVNQYETEKIRETLEQAGFKTIGFGSAADVYVINTCSVTSVADSKSRAAVRRALRLNPEAFVIVSGCYAELEPDEIEAIEGVDLVVPNAEKDAIPERIVARFAESGKLKVESGKPGRVRPRTRTRAVVKVQDGCDQFCSYCVIPFARSHKTSRPLDDVLSELRMLAEFGYREIVLAGIRLGAFGSGESREVESGKWKVESPEKGKTGLPELIREAVKVEGIERIRLSSIEPWEVNDRLLDAMDSPKVCRHLHIPLQAGDDGVLKRMNRPYTSAEYRDIISGVRERIPGIGITTDVIVGFPGETDEAFEHTCEMIEQMDFSRLHVFRYSARERTRAAAMPDQVIAEIRRERAEKLAELGKTAMRRFASSFIGQTLEVLVETEAKLPKHLSGFADNYVEVRFPGEASLKGKIVRVRVTEVDQDGALAVLSNCG